jgi:hypothetical protein
VKRKTWELLTESGRVDGYEGIIPDS